MHKREANHHDPPLQKHELGFLSDIKLFLKDI